MKRWLVVLLVAALAASPGAASAQTPTCTFVLGFATLRTLIGPGVAGECSENQKPASFGAMQGTTRGVFLWFSTRNISLFLGNDNMVWINGPFGLQVRRIDEYYEWEVAGGQEPLIATTERPSVPVGSAPAAPSPALPQRRTMTRNQLEVACFEASSAVLLSGLGGPDRSAEASAVDYLCKEAITKDGERGLACFQEAHKIATGMARLFPNSNRAATAYDDAYRACIARAP